MSLSEKETQIVEGLLDLLDELEKDDKKSKRSPGYPVLKNPIDYIKKLYYDSLTGKIKPARDFLMSLENDNLSHSTERKNIPEHQEEKTALQNKAESLNQKNREKAIENNAANKETDVLLELNQIQEKIAQLNETLQGELKKLSNKQDAAIELLKSHEQFSIDVQHKNKSPETNELPVHSKDDATTSSEKKEKSKEDGATETNQKPKSEKLPEVKLSDKDMKTMRDEVVNFNTKRRYRGAFGLALPSEEANYRENALPATMQERISRPTCLEKTGGNVNFSGTQLEADTAKSFLFPIKSIAFNQETLWTNAYGYFFEIENQERVMGQESHAITLLQPAIVEQRQDGNYHLVQRGKLKLDA